MTRIRLLKRALYVVPVIGAMAFGTTQVFASSTAPIASMRAACLTVREPPTSPVVALSPVRV